MSIHVLNLVWRTDMPPNKKLMLLAYADGAQDDGSEIWPGRDKLCLKTGYSARSVERLTEELVQDGYLVRVTRGRKGRRASFRIPLDVLGEQPFIPTVCQDGTLNNGSRVPSATSQRATHGTPSVLEPSSLRTTSLRSVVRAADSVPPATPYENGHRSKLKDAAWDTLAELFGQPAPQHRKAFGRIAWYLADWALEHGHDTDRLAAEIRYRTGRIATDWNGTSKATPYSVEKHWSRYDGEVGQLTDTQAAELIDRAEWDAAIARAEQRGLPE